MFQQTMHDQISDQKSYCLASLLFGSFGYCDVVITGVVGGGQGEHAKEFLEADMM